MLKSGADPLALAEPLRATLQRLRDVLDMGVVPDVPQSLERAFTEAAAAADVVITSGGVSVGDADYVRQQLNRLGEVLFWKIAMKTFHICEPPVLDIENDGIRVGASDIVPQFFTGAG